jgi:glycosyltransferase involved in cell wall biosynthesis
VTGYARVRGNDWGVLAPPPPGAWAPESTVSVIIPAYNCQEFVDLALAALTRQTYPARLLEVVVVDDGSEPKIELPDLAPEHSRVVRVPDHSTGWGRANALHVGAMASEGAILHWLDADLVPFPHHVEAQARWHHVAPDAVTLGYKRFVSSGPWPTPQEVARGPVEQLIPVERTEPHGYVEEFIAATDGLRAADHLAFRAHVGATAALRRDLYLAAGGLRPDLKLGEDSEFGYRLAQVGAVFIPEPAAGSWHLGPSNMMRDGEALRRYNRPFLADLMPQPRWLRGNAPGRGWRVPLITAVVRAHGRLEDVRDCVDRLLVSDERDLQVLLEGDWRALTDGRRRVLDDPLLDLRLLAATYAGDPRVHLVTRAPDSAFPSPYLLRVPVGAGIGPRAVREIVAYADEHRLGLLRVLPPGAGEGTAPPVVELWRTAAVMRAQRVLGDSETLPEAVASVWGASWVDGDHVSVSDPVLPDAATPTGTGSPQPAPIPVAGVRSLVKATGLVARLAVRRAGRRLRSPFARSARGP